MNAAELRRLCGMPIDCARAELEKNGVTYSITEYCSRRGELGPDKRVLRAQKRGNAAVLVVGSFLTDIKQVF